MLLLLLSLLFVAVVVVVVIEVASDRQRSAIAKVRKMTTATTKRGFELLNHF